MRWTKEQMQFLTDNYPTKGKQFCIDALCLKEHQVRSKASKMGLKARGISEAWHSNNKKHSVRMSGRKRPDHSAKMKALYEQGKNPLSVYVKSHGSEISERTRERISIKGHPRGALGLKHSEESKSKMSKASKKYWKNMTDEKRDEYSMRASVNARKFASMNRNNASWKSGWREIGGQKNYYRSRWEANYARYLDWLKNNGEIFEWKHEPKTFWFDGIKRGCVSYLPDFFVVEKNGSESYHEVKGWMDDRSKTKIKRMAKYHPNVKLIVIDSKQYKSLERTMLPLIPDWEK